jgi:hypothetical protein
MAEAVVPEPQKEPSSKADESLPRFERPQAVHSGRFLIGYGVVVVLVLAMLVTLGVMSRNSDSSSTPAAAGVPVREDGFMRAREIATEVARQYRGSNGEQIVAVTAQPGEVSGLPLQYIALRHGRNRPLTEGDVTVVQPGETALFSFCGLGGQQNCALPGEPTPDRLMLLRREAVELSFYTFKLLPEIETVVSLLPPVTREGQPPQTFAVWFQRRHMQNILDRPLTRMLPERAPFAEGDITPGESEMINKLTETRLFTSSFEQLQTQGVILNLSPPSA